MERNWIERIGTSHLHIYMAMDKWFRDWKKNWKGLAVGDKKDVTVTPAEGYGDLNPQLKIEVDRANFPKDADIQPGMQFEGQGDGGTRTVFTVKAVVGDKIHVDGNHPLAGETLYFSIEIMGVRNATEEELTHGHAHGEGGHHH